MHRGKGARGGSAPTASASGGANLGQSNNVGSILGNGASGTGLAPPKSRQEAVNRLFGGVQRKLTVPAPPPSLPQDEEMMDGGGPQLIQVDEADDFPPPVFSTGAGAMPAPPSSHPLASVENTRQYQQPRRQQSHPANPIPRQHKPSVFSPNGIGLGELVAGIQQAAADIAPLASQQSIGFSQASFAFQRAGAGAHTQDGGLMAAARLRANGKRPGNGRPAPSPTHLTFPQPSQQQQLPLQPTSVASNPGPTSFAGGVTMQRQNSVGSLSAAPSQAGPVMMTQQPPQQPMGDDNRTNANNGGGGRQRTLLSYVKVIVPRVNANPFVEGRQPQKIAKPRGAAAAPGAAGGLVATASNGSSSSSSAAAGYGPAGVNNNTAQTKSHYFMHFEELGALGSGGFSMVYKARSRMDGCVYAIKRGNETLMARRGRMATRGARAQRKNLQQQQSSTSPSRRDGADDDDNDDCRTDEGVLTGAQGAELKEVHALALLSGSDNVIRYFGSWVEDEHLYMQTELAWGSVEDAVIGRRPAQTGLHTLMTLHAQQQVVAFQAACEAAAQLKASCITMSGEEEAEHQEYVRGLAMAAHNACTAAFGAGSSQRVLVAMPSDPDHAARVDAWWRGNFGLPEAPIPTYEGLAAAISELSSSSAASASISAAAGQVAQSVPGTAGEVSTAAGQSTAMAVEGTTSAAADDVPAQPSAVAAPNPASLPARRLSLLVNCKAAAAGHRVSFGAPGIGLTSGGTSTTAAAASSSGGATSSADSGNNNRMLSASAFSSSAASLSASGIHLPFPSASSASAPSSSSLPAGAAAMMASCAASSSSSSSASSSSSSAAAALSGIMLPGAIGAVGVGVGVGSSSPPMPNKAPPPVVTKGKSRSRFQSDADEENDESQGQTGAAMSDEDEDEDGAAGRGRLFAGSSNSFGVSPSPSPPPRAPIFASSSSSSSSASSQPAGMAMGISMDEDGGGSVDGIALNRRGMLSFTDASQSLPPAPAPAPVAVPVARSVSFAGLGELTSDPKAVAAEPVRISSVVPPANRGTAAAVGGQLGKKRSRDATSFSAPQAPTAANSTAVSTAQASMPSAASVPVATAASDIRRFFGPASSNPGFGPAGAGGKAKKSTLLKSPTFLGIAGASSAASSSSASSSAASVERAAKRQKTIESSNDSGGVSNSESQESASSSLPLSGGGGVNNNANNNSAAVSHALNFDSGNSNNGNSNDDGAATLFGARSHSGTGASSFAALRGGARKLSQQPPQNKGKGKKKGVAPHRALSSCSSADSCSSNADHEAADGGDDHNSHHPFADAGIDSTPIGSTPVAPWAGFGAAQDEHPFLQNFGAPAPAPAVSRKAGAPKNAFALMLGAANGNANANAGAPQLQLFEDANTMAVPPSTAPGPGNNNNNGALFASQGFIPMTGPMATGPTRPPPALAALMRSTSIPGGPMGSLVTPVFHFGGLPGTGVHGGAPALDNPNGALHTRPRYKLAERDVLNLLSDVATGLACMHRNGLAHLDVKPSNLLVFYECGPSLCDVDGEWLPEATVKTGIPSLDSLVEGLVDDLYRQKETEILVAAGVVAQPPPPQRQQQESNDDDDGDFLLGRVSASQYANGSAEDDHNQSRLHLYRRPASSTSGVAPPVMAMAMDTSADGDANESGSQIAVPTAISAAPAGGVSRQDLASGVCSAVTANSCGMDEGGNSALLTSPALVAPNPIAPSSSSSSSSSSSAFVRRTESGVAVAAANSGLRAQGSSSMSTGFKQFAQGNTGNNNKASRKQSGLNSAASSSSSAFFRSPGAIVMPRGSGAGASSSSSLAAPGSASSATSASASIMGGLVRGGGRGNAIVRMMTLGGVHGPSFARRALSAMQRSASGAASAVALGTGQRASINANSAARKPANPNSAASSDGRASSTDLLSSHRRQRSASDGSTRDVFAMEAEAAAAEVRPQGTVSKKAETASKALADCSPDLDSRDDSDDHLDSSAADKTAPSGALIAEVQKSLSQGNPNDNGADDDLETSLGFQFRQPQIAVRPDEEDDEEDDEAEDDGLLMFGGSADGAGVGGQPLPFRPRGQSNTTNTSASSRPNSQPALRAMSASAVPLFMPTALEDDEPNGHYADGSGNGLAPTLNRDMIEGPLATAMVSLFSPPAPPRRENSPELPPIPSNIPPPRVSWSRWHRTGRVLYKLGDLGQAVKVTATDVTEGDSRYLARELLEGDCRNLRACDVFSLGISLYELATGTPLPTGGDHYQLLRDGLRAMFGLERGEDDDDDEVASDDDEDDDDGAFERAISPGFGAHMPARAAASSSGAAQTSADKPLGQLSVGLRRLIRRMVHPDTSKRPTCEQILAHPLLVRFREMQARERYGDWEGGRQDDDPAASASAGAAPVSTTCVWTSDGKLFALPPFNNSTSPASAAAAASSSAGSGVDEGIQTEELDDGNSAPSSTSPSAPSELVVLPHLLPAAGLKSLQRMRGPVAATATTNAVVASSPAGIGFLISPPAGHAAAPRLGFSEPTSSSSTYAMRQPAFLGSTVRLGPADSGDELEEDDILGAASSGDGGRMSIGELAPTASSSSASSSSSAAVLEWLKAAPPGAAAAIMADLRKLMMSATASTSSSSGRHSLDFAGPIKGATSSSEIAGAPPASGAESDAMEAL